MKTTPGKVYLVGAGPGDPGLITVKGKRCLEEAQVVVYDRLMDPSLLRWAPESAQLVFVGKERGRQAMTQDEINLFLVDRASEGQIVVRLKGGDPFVFGRGGEEALALAENQIPFEVVPGITSSIAAAAYAGIPITHRGIATAFTVVSGSEDPTKPDSTVPWDILAKNGGTLVVLMGLAALGSIVETLGRNGMPLDTPAALVRTLPAPYEVEFTVDGGADRTAFESLDGVVSVMETGAGYSLRSSDTSRTLPALFGWASGARVRLDQLEVKPATLEDVFLSLTGKVLPD